MLFKVNVWLSVTVVIPLGGVSVKQHIVTSLPVLLSLHTWSECYSVYELYMFTKYVLCYNLHK